MKTKYYRCDKCGKVVALVKSGAGTLECCNTPMKEIENKQAEDYLLEKHLPTYVRKKTKLNVRIGSELHPYTPVHHIEWISVLTNKGFQMKLLDPLIEPITTFNLDKDEKIEEITSYCNIHGLYSISIDVLEDNELDDCGCTL